MKQLVIDNAFTTLGYSQLQMNEAIERIQQEHIILQEELRDLYIMARSIGEKGTINRTGVLQQLRAKMELFKLQMDAHAAWENETLFPMISWYFTEDLDQFTLMEQEHVLAEQFIQAFVDALERAPVRLHEQQEMASYLSQAIVLLNSHFRLEEDLIDTLIDRSDSYGY